MSKILVDKQVLEQALDALEDNIEYDFHGNPYEEVDELLQVAAAKLRAALEQPQDYSEQRLDMVPADWKLVPFCYASVNKQGDVTSTIKRKDSWRKTPLYLHPQPPRQPLTDKRILEVGWAVKPYANQMEILAVARAIEEEHEIK